MVTLRTIGIITNTQKDAGLAFTRTVAEYLSKKGCRVLLPESAGEVIYRAAEALVVLGGDGTILQAARYAAVHDTPLLGINLGTLGYLTAVERQEAFPALDLLLAGGCKRESRMMLEAAVHDGGDGEPLLALNDVCVYRGQFSKLIEITLFVNGARLDTFRADGVLIATPTGATAYNLAAGGPILKPDSEMIAITAICPHTLYTRPWVLPAADEITVQLSGCQEESLLVVDGQNRGSLAEGSRVTVRRSAYHATILKVKDLDFFSILRQKMAWN